jgi:hypothetical protein
VYAIAGIIEIARREQRNPEVPSRLRSDYDAAWRHLVDLAIRDIRQAEDATLVSSIIAVVAIGKGMPALGRMAMLMEDERTEMLDKSGWG